MPFWKSCIFRMKQHGFPILFIVTFLSLISLVTWWSVFIRQSIVYQYHSNYENLKAHLEVYSTRLGHDQTTRPEPGSFPHDDRLEITMCDDREGTFNIPLDPHWSSYCISPTNEYIETVEKEFRSKTFMIFGESGFLILVLCISTFMLIRMLWLEKRSDREVHELWSRITHEIKSPITGIKAFLQTLKSQPIPQDQLVPLVDMALREVDRQQQLAENLLIGRRLENGGHGLSSSAINLKSYLNDYLSTKNLLLGNLSVDIVWRTEEDLCVRADADALRVVCDNLLDNAAKYCENTPRLTLEIRTENKRGIISFIDNGRGFHPSMAEDIFRAFKRLTNELPKNSRGTGMGLHISRQLLRKMGGDLTASSSGEGKGATFSVYLKQI
jgi:nitrogen-specific signal transduction histidine kinase